MSKLLIHTIEQPDSDTSCFILSCDRLDLLDKTINSFLSTRDYDTKMVIVDDSGKQELFPTLVEKYGSFCDIVMFPKNRSQWWAMDFMVSYCDTEYIFYLEDDWELLKPGYLNISKQILQKYRHIGTVDISWRTFENENLETYEKQLIDNTFYYKKFWRITDYHLRWYGWIGSPNLKRREDLILLGNVEKYFHEIWIDRKYYSLGFKSVYVNDKYVEHLGDNRSRASQFRINEHLTPEDKYPKELLPYRTWPKLDYSQWDTDWRHPHDITLVSASVNINRNDRNFKDHYLKSLKNLLESRHPIVLYAEKEYFPEIRELRKNLPLILREISTKDIQKKFFTDKIQNIISKPQWYNQSEWMRESVITNPLYIPLTLLKQYLLLESLDCFNSSHHYWIDSGMFNSFNISESINNFYFTKIPKDKFFMTSFKYYTISEIHGYNIKELIKECGENEFKNCVCRATIFGGKKESIQKVSEIYENQIIKSLEKGNIGTEESIYTILSHKYPELFHIFEMPNGDIKNLLNTLR